MSEARHGRARALLGFAFVGAAAAFLFFALRGQRHEIGSALDRLSWQACAGAVIALVLGLVAVFLAWRVVLTSLGSHLGTRDAAQIYFLGQLGKYLPGSVWPVVAQMEMGAAHEVPRASMFWATTVAIVVGIVSGAVVGVLAVPSLLSQSGNGYLLALIAIPLGLVLLHPRVLNRLVAIALRIFRREPLEHQITRRAVIQCFGFYVIAWLLQGLQIFLLAHSIGGDAGSLLFLSIGAYAIAFVCGFLFIVAPAGLGVREAVLILCLGTVLSTSSATAVALVSRLLVTLADAIVGGLALVSYLAFGRRRRQASPSDARQAS